MNDSVNPDEDLLELKYIDVKNSKPEKSIEGKVLDELNLHKYCCRRMMLGNVHIISYLSQVFDILNILLDKNILLR